MLSRNGIDFSEPSGLEIPQPRAHLRLLRVRPADIGLGQQQAQRPQAVADRPASLVRAVRSRPLSAAPPDPPPPTDTVTVDPDVPTDAIRKAVSA